jgi:hypothetical protein
MAKRKTVISRMSRKDKFEASISRLYPKYGKQEVKTNAIYWEDYRKGNERVRIKTSRGIPSPISRAHENLYDRFSKNPKTTGVKRPTSSISQPSTNARTRNVKMGKIDPKLVFQIDLSHSYKLMLSARGVDVSKVSRIVEKEIHSAYLIVVKDIYENIIGNPDVSGGQKGIFPRGGTGFLRSFTRNMIERQVPYSNMLPVKLYLGVPVEYANVVNNMTTSRIAHSPQYAYRITDYYGTSGGRFGRKWNKIRLNDPNATTNFFETALEMIRVKMAERVKIFIPRLNTALKGIVPDNMYTQYTTASQFRITKDSFDYGPDQFKKEIDKLPNHFLNIP